MGIKYLILSERFFSLAKIWFLCMLFFVIAQNIIGVCNQLPLLLLVREPFIISKRSMISKLLFSCGNILHHVLNTLFSLLFFFLQLSLYSYQFEVEDKWTEISGQFCPLTEHCTQCNVSKVKPSFS